MSKKVLICDDEEGVRESLKLVLEDHFEFIEVDRGDKAVETAQNNPDIKVALLDIKMPKMNGLETLVQLKEARPDVNVIMVTGYQSVETAQEAINKGASGYIVKPFDSQEVIDQVQRYMECN